jgi:peroxiredoxin Q/BCP
MAGAPLKLKEGDPAPDFTAPVGGGGTVTLSALAGKPVVLFFYPKDNTPGCTREACAFRDVHGQFARKGAVVLGVSVDPVKSHDKFDAKYGFPFQLVSDSDKRIVKAYGVWGQKKFMGRTYQGTHRVTFLIDAGGRIARIWETVKPETHAEEVLAAL